MRIEFLDWCKRPWGQRFCGRLNADGDPLVCVASNGHVESLATIVTMLQRRTDSPETKNAKCGGISVPVDDELQSARAKALQRCTESTASLDCLACAWFLVQHSLVAVLPSQLGVESGSGIVSGSAVATAMEAANKIVEELHQPEVAAPDQQSLPDNVPGKKRVEAAKVMHIVDCDDESVGSGESDDAGNPSTPEDLWNVRSSGLTCGPD